MDNRTKAHIAVLTTNLLFAANFSIIKYISPQYVKPFGLNIIRVGVSVILFWSLWLLGNRKAGIKKKHIGRFIACALSGVALNQMLFMKGITLTSAIHASLLMLSAPLLITLFAFWVLKERVTFGKILGLGLGIGGSALLVVLKNPVGSDESSTLGDLLIISNAASYALYFIFVNPLMTHYHPLHIIRWIFTIGFFMILPFGWGQFVSIDWNSFHWSQWLSLASVVIGGTFLAYYLNIFGLQRLGAAITGSYIYTQPVLASVIAIVFLGENLSLPKIGAGLMIFLGVFLVSYKKREKLEVSGLDAR